MENDFEEFHDDYEYYNNEGEFQNEVNFLERVGFDDGFENSEIFERVTALRDPTQKFTTFVRIIANSLIQRNILNLERSEIPLIISQIKNFPSPGYKNPTGFVLGYWVLQNGKIDEKRLKKVFPILSNLDFPVKPHDVIRYARLWLTKKLNS
jgi:hypothetical protein